MVFRFWFELAAGIITLISLLIFREKGIAVLAIIALLPIIYRLKKIEPDERETQNFYKGTQYIINVIVIIIILSVFVFKVQISDLTSISRLIFYYILTSILIIVSAFRLYLHYRH